VLRRLGFEPRLVSQEAKGPALGEAGYVPDYPAASNFLSVLFSCRSGFNLTQFCSRRIDAEMRRASHVEATDMGAANAIWTRADRDVSDAAPLVPLYTANRAYFVSKRIGNFQWAPISEVLEDQLWVR
jgi:ABC-type oligopeptide transport system substrate-binding subunit